MFQNYQQDIGREVEKLASGLNQCFWKYSLTLEKIDLNCLVHLHRDFLWIHWKNWGDLWQFEHTHAYMYHIA